MGKDRAAYGIRLIETIAENVRSKITAPELLKSKINSLLLTANKVAMIDQPTWFKSKECKRRQIRKILLFINIRLSCNS
jgi:hypothetical protein